MNICFKETPKLFGLFHLTSLLVILVSSIIVFLIFKKKEDRFLLSFIHICGIVMILAEIWKQIFTHIYVHNGIYNMWFFPWQLCSMSMYCGAILPYLKRRAQNCVLVFLSCFSLVAAVTSLIAPLNMLRPQILLTLHGFIYHGFMIYITIAAIIILRRRNDHNFKDSVFLFLIMSLIAEIINVLAHQIFHDTYREPNMFYITPYYPSTQPVFDLVAHRFGIPAEIIFYLSAIIFFSYLLYLLFTRYLKAMNGHEEE